MASFKDQLKNIKKLKFQNSQAYFWFTYDLFINEYNQFKNRIYNIVLTGDESIPDEQSFINLFNKEDEKLFWMEFNNKKNNLMKYVSLLFNLQGELESQDNYFNFKQIQDILFSNSKNEQGIMIHALIKAESKSYGAALFYYNIATAAFYKDRKSLSEIRLTTQSQYDMMESRIQSAIENSKKDVVFLNIFKHQNEKIIEEAIREFREENKLSK